MSTRDQDKSGGKPRQRGRKADQRGQKPEQQQSPERARRNDDQIAAKVASTEASANGKAAMADVALVGEVLPPAATSIGATARLDHGPITALTLAKAYEDYTRKAFEESRSFVERLMGVRSFDKAIEVQTEFARQAYANLVTESQRICELYSELAKQIFRPWERLAAKVTEARRHI